MKNCTIIEIQLKKFVQQLFVNFKRGHYLDNFPVTALDVWIKPMLRICLKVHAHCMACMQGHWNWIVPNLTCILRKQHWAHNNLITFYFQFAFYFQTYWQPWVTSEFLKGCIFSDDQKVALHLHSLCQWAQNLDFFNYHIFTLATK